MSNSKKPSDSVISQFPEECFDNDGDVSEVDDEIVDPDFCIEESDMQDEISMVADACSEYDDSNTMIVDEIVGNDEEELVVEENVCESRVNYFYGKNGFKWSALAPTRCVKTPLHNIVRLPVATQPKSENDLCGYWSRIFDAEMENMILEHTNTKLKAKFDLTAQIEAKMLDKIELRAFFGILIYSSVFKSNHEAAQFMFATDGTGREVFRATMSKARFLSILNCLRFDNGSDRKQRLLNDPLAAVSDMFNKFIENCRKSYSIGTHACIDEMLVPFRGRCKFKIYMPMKPAKYGIKIMSLTDARTQYPAFAYIYFRKTRMELV